MGKAGNPALRHSWPRTAWRIVVLGLFLWCHASRLNPHAPLQVSGQGSVAVPLVCRGPKALALTSGTSTASPVVGAGGAYSQAVGVGSWRGRQGASSSLPTPPPLPPPSRGPAFVLAGAVVTQPVALLDLAATFLDAAVALCESRSLLLLS